LIELPGFTPRDRVLVVAPHPDDESIATGGVLQAARTAGAARRVLLVTDGDNNPWPQRWVEKRWRIGAAARARWGARRRAEALSALAMLGVDNADVICFGWPDLGLTGALMSGNPDAIGPLSVQIAAFAPTHLFLPALDDRHPDHSALHVLVRLALSRCAEVRPSLYSFGVHGTVDPRDMVALTLSEGQRETKAAAIQQHTTQMQLSRRRFVAYAKRREPFRQVPQVELPDAAHAVQAAARSGKLQVAIERGSLREPLRGRALFIVLDRASGAPYRCMVRLTGATHGTAFDPSTGNAAGSAQIDKQESRMLVTLAVEDDCAGGWIKLGRPTPGLFVFDKTGWQVVAAEN